MRFLGLSWRMRFPTPRAVALSRGAGLRAVEELFDQFNGFLKNRPSRHGRATSMRRSCRAQTYDSVTRTPVARDNKTIKEGETPKIKQADQKPQRTRRWTKKHERSYFGYRTISASIAGTNSCAVVVERRERARQPKFEDVLDTSLLPSGRGWAG
jgi:hypothetical protein